MNYLLIIVTAVLCVGSLMMFLRDVKSNSDKLETNSGFKGLIIYSVIMIAVTIAIAVMVSIVFKGNDMWTNVKRLSLLTVLWPIAYIDFKSYRIPNSFILMGIGYRIVILAFELLFNDGFNWMTLISEVIAAAALFLAAMLCSLCMKNSIGYGDIKLFVVMGLLLGLEGIWSAIFLSLIVSFFVSVFLLVTKKKTRKDVIPFGPAIVLGTYLSVCLS